MGYVFVILKIPSNAGHNISCVLCILKLFQYSKITPAPCVYLRTFIGRNEQSKNHLEQHLTDKNDCSD
jgi:hypothetical protein